MIKFKHVGFKLATLRDNNDTAKLIYMRSAFRTILCDVAPKLRYYTVVQAIMSSLYLVVDGDNVYYISSHTGADVDEDKIIQKVLQYNNRKYLELLRTPESPVCIWFKELINTYHLSLPKV